MMNILIIKLGAIGDLLMTTPAIRAVKKANPDAHISLLLGKSSKAAALNNPYIYDCIECDDYIIYKGKFLEKLKYLIALVSMIKKRKYDIIFIFHWGWQFSLFAFLCGIPERVGFERNVGGMFLTKRVRISGVKHHIDKYLEVIKKFGIKDDGRGMDFTISGEAEKAADEILKEKGIKKENIKIGISAGGAINVKEEMAIRRWPLEYYIELSRKIVADGYEVILLGADSDKPNAATILEAIKNGVIDLTGKTTLEETAAVMKRCNIIVTHDSGPMHLASAVGMPVVSIFGPTHPMEKYPLNEGSFYFWNKANIECAPCYRDGNFPDCKDPLCMKAVAVDEVYEKVKDIIGARGIN